MAVKETARPDPGMSRAASGLPQRGGRWKPRLHVSLVNDRAADHGATEQVLMRVIEDCMQEVHECGRALICVCVSGAALEASLHGGVQHSRCAPFFPSRTLPLSSSSLHKPSNVYTSLLFR